MKLSRKQRSEKASWDMACTGLDGLTFSQRIALIEAYMLASEDILPAQLLEHGHRMSRLADIRARDWPTRPETSEIRVETGESQGRVLPVGRSPAPN